jgi:hypothetical protein
MLLPWDLFLLFLLFDVDKPFYNGSVLHVNIKIEEEFSETLIAWHSLSILVNVTIEVDNDWKSWMLCGARSGDDAGGARHGHEPGAGE